MRRSCWTCGRVDHVAATCTSGHHAVGKRRDETTATFGITRGPLRVNMPKAMDGVSVGAEEVKTHQTVSKNRCWNPR